MDKLLFDRYKQNKKKLIVIERDLKKLHMRLENVPTVSGKVTRSSDDFPYIEEHVTVKVLELKEATKIKLQIKNKEEQKNKIVAEIEAVEVFIEALPEGREKQVMAGIYLDGKTQTAVARENACTQARVSQIIKEMF